MSINPGSRTPQWRCAQGEYAMTELTITRRGLIGGAAASVGLATAGAAGRLASAAM